jgi:hypothetical protein
VSFCRIISALKHIRRFGQYVLDMNDLPDPLQPQPQPISFEAAL